MQGSMHLIYYYPYILLLFVYFLVLSSLLQFIQLLFIIVYFLSSILLSLRGVVQYIYSLWHKAVCRHGQVFLYVQSTQEIVEPSCSTAFYIDLVLPQIAYQLMAALIDNEYVILAPLVLLSPIITSVYSSRNALWLEL